MNPVQQTVSRSTYILAALTLAAPGPHLWFKKPNRGFHSNSPLPMVNFHTLLTSDHWGCQHEPTPMASRHDHKQVLLIWSAGVEIQVCMWTMRYECWYPFWSLNTVISKFKVSAFYWDHEYHQITMTFMWRDKRFRFFLWPQARYHMCDRQMIREADIVLIYLSCRPWARSSNDIFLPVKDWLSTRGFVNHFGTPAQFKSSLGN